MDKQDQFALYAVLFLSVINTCLTFIMPLVWLRKK